MNARIREAQRRVAAYMWGARAEVVRRQLNQMRQSYP